MNEPPKRYGRHGYHPTVVEQALSRVRSGQSLRQIEAEMKITRQAISTWAKRAGVTVGRGFPRGAIRDDKKIDPPALQAKTAVLRAEGLSVNEIGRALKVSSTRIRAILDDPGVQVDIARRRSIAKQIASEALPVLTAKAYELAEQTIDAKDTKGFDATMRGLHAAEKIAASVSGENQRMQVEHSGTVETTGQTTAIEQLNVLINAAMGR